MALGSPTRRPVSCATWHLIHKISSGGFMPHVLRVGAIVFVYLGASYGLLGETPDPRLDDVVKRLDDAVKEIALLKRMTADQDRRIAGLERTVRAQQSAID